MRSLLLASMVLLLAPVARGDGAPPEAGQPAPSDDDSYVAAYKALAAQELQAKKIDALPAGDFKRIEVKQRIKSASFGHQTTLAVPKSNPKQFFVEFGRSTNRPAQTFGPFELK